MNIDLPDISNRMTPIHNLNCVSYGACACLILLRIGVVMSKTNKRCGKKT